MGLQGVALAEIDLFAFASRNFALRESTTASNCELLTVANQQ